MSCKQYFLNYFGQNKEYHGLLQFFSVKFIFLDKAMNSGKKCENSWFSLFFVWTNKNAKCWCKMIVDNGRDLCKIFNLSVKNWRSYGHFPCCHGNCYLNFISWCSFWAHWGKKFRFTYFSGSYVDSFCSLCLFSAKLGEKIQYETMTSLCWWRH